MLQGQQAQDVLGNQTFGSFDMEGMSMIYIAVGKDYKSDKRKLLFVLQQFPGPIGILHVHSPSKLIPICKS
ncbi:hypothetical protein SORBI_3001G037200 [Sorghum bicolor]|uniref:Uncharacterized protein n=1 Tax=Sorghum bicolor TaxID=4558 RepID=A0A1B6QH67_SORBI|nr:hypothetical protein SORBI_3001G037200 [Sorghum bicolor]